jgi:hypothetical protein
MMTNRHLLLIRHGLAVAAIFAFALVGHAAEPVKPAAPEAKPAAPEADVVDPKAVALIKAMGDFLKAQPSFSFTVDQSYDVVQQDCEKLEFGGVRTYIVRRPDHLRIDGDARDGSPRTLYFDGNQIAVSIPGDHAYALAKLKEHRDLDTTLRLARDYLEIQVPLSGLLRSDPTKEILEGLDSAYLVGKETLGGVECQHLALETDEIDGQLWIATGNQPLPRRVVIEYRELEGQPRYAATFTSWSLSPDATDSVFAFTPPAGAERVRFSVRGRDVQPPEEPKK